MEIHRYQSDQALHLESGQTLKDWALTYASYGPKLSPRRIIWVCHALTANAQVLDWWSGLFQGPQAPFDPKQDWIICPNNLGSCYGSTGPTSLNPDTGKIYGADFPDLTIRDMAQAHIRLAQALGLKKIDLLIGGSQGGQQVLEWAYLDASRLDKLVVLATNARHSAWGIAFNEAQRMALEAGPQGLAAARAIAMLSYRNYQMYARTQTESQYSGLHDYGAANYQRYQGQKLAQRFDPQSYRCLSLAMDRHNLGRNRNPQHDPAQVLAQIQLPTLVIGIDSDGLFPIEEQAYLAQHLPQAQFQILTSPYGHDGFLTETTAIGSLIQAFLH